VVEAQADHGDLGRQPVDPHAEQRRPVDRVPDGPEEVPHRGLRDARVAVAPVGPVDDLHVGGHRRLHLLGHPGQRVRVGHEAHPQHLLGGGHMLQRPGQQADVEVAPRQDRAHG
jgi:hypothetical protein